MAFITFMFLVFRTGRLDPRLELPKRRMCGPPHEPTLKDVNETCAASLSTFASLSYNIALSEKFFL